MARVEGVVVVILGGFMGAAEGGEGRSVVQASQQR